MSFVDKCQVFFKAGDGGDGIVAWRREAHVPLGGPSGGDGGNGGSIILVGDHNEHSLQNLKFLRKIIAKNGEKGQIKTMHGANAKDIYVKVPLGTIVIDLKTNEEIADIEYDHQEFIVCKGGNGGYGNFHFKSGYNKAPKLYELGDKGQERDCQLILKQIADVGIIGLPNAGKSTFLSKITNAKPNIGNYQFTTLKPILGIYKNNNKPIIFADIPGLIEGASQGYGLGHDFLKHIERTKVLIHLVSMNKLDNEDPYISYKVIMNELKKYNSKLLEKPMIVVANKMDCADSKELFNHFKEKLKNLNIIPISALNDENLNQVVDLSINAINNQNKTCKNLNDEKIINQNINNDEEYNKQLVINKIDKHVWNIECEYLQYWAHKIPLTTSDNIMRFNQKMKNVNVEDELKKMGALKGDIIKIYNHELEYEE